MATPAGARHLEDAMRPQHLQQAVHLVLGARDLDDERIGRDVDDARAEDVGQRCMIGFAVSAVAVTLIIAKVANDRRRGDHVLHAADVDELVEVRLRRATALSSVSTTISMRERPGVSVRPTVSDSML